MPRMPLWSRTVVYDPDTGRLELRQLPLRLPRPGEILVRVRLSAICGSDLHTIRGRRRPRGPLVLGHEICGTVAALGDGVARDSAGLPLSAGDRITWGIAASCGRCFFCAHGIPQKCESLFKYGHETIDTEPPLNGGFAEYLHLVPGTAVYRLPHGLDDDRAVFANCSLATMAAAVRLAGMAEGEAVLIQGAGLVGLCAAALCTDRGARAVVVTDISPDRLARAARFGATHTFNAEGAPEAFANLAAKAAGSRGFDVAIEACGQPHVIPDGIRTLRIGGRYIIAGCVFPDATAEIDFHPVITKLLRLQGLHNYTPQDLETALQFLDTGGRRFPFDQVVDSHYPLGDVASALARIESSPGILRVALEP